jgi:exopolysaccharide production protein ExoQ
LVREDRDIFSLNSIERKPPMYSRRSLENVTLCAVALTLTGALMRIVSGGGDNLDGDYRTQAFLAVCYFSVAAIAAAHFRSTLWAIRRNPAICALLAVACLSIFWADMPDLVLRRAIAVVGTTLFGVVVAIRLTFAEQLRLFRWATRIAAAMSLALLIVAPGAAFAAGAESSTVRGIFNHKNHLGATMALGLLMEWFVPETNRKAKVLRGIFLAVYFAMLVLSNSMTSVVALGTTLVVVYSFRFLYSRCRLPLPMLFAIFLAGAGVAMAIESSATELLGRSSDLTGRTELWGFTLNMISKRPLLGFGLSGFWMGASEESLSVQSQLGWTPIYSHNGYLEILLSLGIVGLLLLLVVVGSGIKRVLARVHSNGSIQDMWPIAFFTFFLVHNLAECTILLQNCLEWSLCVATVISCDAILVGALSTTDEERERSRVPEAEYA